MVRPTPEQLRALLRYEPVTGKLFWRERGPEWFDENGKRSAQWRAKRWNSRHAGEEAGSDNGSGYIVVSVLGIRIKAHQAIWAICFGVWPDGEVDHLNGDTSGNWLLNLRDATHAENGKNQALHSNNSSGVSGVCWRKSSRRWVAYITSSGKQIHLGTFPSKGEAIAARHAAEIEHNFHPNHGQRSAQA